MKNALRIKSTGFKLWTIAAVAGAWMALGAFGGTTPAFGQSLHESEECQGPEISRFEGCQRLEGSWLYTVTIPNPSGAPTVFQGVETYAAGGGYSEADQLSFTPGYLATAGHGAWKSTGERAFLLTYLNLTYDPSGNATGKSKVRQIAKMDNQGKTYSGSGDFTYYDLDGKWSQPAPSPSPRSESWCRRRSSLLKKRNRRDFVSGEAPFRFLSLAGNTIPFR